MIAVAPRKPGTASLRRLRVHREDADGAGEVLLELAEGGVVGEHHEPPVRAGDGHGVEDAAGDQLARGVLRRHQVVQDLRDDRVAQLRVDGVEQVRGVLLEPAEGVASPVRAGEGEALRLLPAHPDHGGEAPRLLGEVENLDAHRRAPGRAVVGPEEEAVQTSRLVVPGDDGPTGRGVRRGSGAAREGRRGLRPRPSVRSCSCSVDWYGAPSGLLWDRCGLCPDAASSGRGHQAKRRKSTRERLLFAEDHAEDPPGRRDERGGRSRGGRWRAGATSPRRGSTGRSGSPPPASVRAHPRGPALRPGPGRRLSG